LLSESNIPKVQVVMSTYNGEKYLTEQVQSILSQANIEVNLLVRDDGSTDSTMQILEAFKKESEGRVTSVKGMNKGVIESFFDALNQTSEDSDFFAFADQDDYWQPEKMMRAVSKIKQAISAASERPDQIPVLYYSKAELVDQDLRHLSFSGNVVEGNPLLSVFENQAIGCTIVFNRCARDLLLKSTQRTPPPGVLHDWWC
jgi:glycosyltransferase involved in cell wall biosynthesis